MRSKKEEYNKEPVHYCPRCLSLEIKADIGDYSYCNHCGSTSIEVTDIFSWEKLYKERYGIRYLDNNY